LVADDRDSKSPPPGNSRGFARQLAEVLDLPFVLVGSVILGAGAGYLLDRWLGSSPAFTLILGALGFAGGMYEVIRRLVGKGNNDGH
jgi:ATP synthase protein I